MAVGRWSFVLREKRNADKGEYSSWEVGGGGITTPRLKYRHVVKCCTGLRIRKFLPRIQERGITSTGRHWAGLL